MKLFRIRNLTRNSVLAERAGFAADSKARRTGLLKHAAFPEGEGLLIAPCELIHTFGMKFPIDAVFLSKKRKVLKIVPNLPARRLAASLLADSVLELPAGTAARTSTAVGDELLFEPLPAATAPDPAT